MQLCNKGLSPRHLPILVELVVRGFGGVERVVARHRHVFFPDPRHDLLLLLLFLGHYDLLKRTTEGSGRP